MDPRNSRSHTARGANATVVWPRSPTAMVSPRALGLAVGLDSMRSRSIARIIQGYTTAVSSARRR